jgi:hypothetical protein
MSRPSAAIPAHAADASITVAALTSNSEIIAINS